MSLVGNSPSIKTILTPTTGVLNLVGNTPSLKTTIAPTTGGLSLAGNSPTLTFSIIPHDRYYAYVESLDRTTTNTTYYTEWKLNLSLDFTPRANKSYIILWSLLVDNDVTDTHQMYVQLWDDTNSIDLSNNVITDAGPTTHNVISSGGAFPMSFGASPPATQTLQIWTAVSDTALTMGVSEANIFVLELVDNIDGVATNLGITHTTGTSWTPKVTVSAVFNANVTSDYLAIVSAAVQSDVGEARVRVNVDSGTLLNVHDKANFNNAVDWTPYNALVRLPGIVAGSSHSIVLEYASSVAGNQVSISDASITILNLSAFLSAYTAEDRTQHISTTTSDADSASITATPEGADHLILAAGQTSTSTAATTTSTRQKVNIGASDIGTIFADMPGWTGYQWSWWFTRKHTETNTETTWKTRYARSTGSANALSDEHVIAALRLEAPGTTTLHPTTGTLALVGNTPTIKLIITPTTGTLSLAGNSPTINVAKILTPTTGTLSLAGNTPTLSLGFGPSTGTLALAGNTASLSQTLVPTTGNLALTGNTPDVSVGAIAPTYESTGTYSRVAGDVSLTPAYPSSPASGDIFVLQFAHRNILNQDTATYGVPGDWTQLATPLVGVPGTSHDRHFSYYKVSDGTETGTITITVTGGQSNAIHQAAIHRFSGAAVDFSEGLNSSIGGSGTNVADAGVTTTGASRLAVNLVFHNNAFDIISFTGETGGDWTTRSASDPANNCSIGVQTADMASAGTVDGGTITSASGLWSVRGFALQPAVGGVTLTPTTGTLALAGNTPSLSVSLAPSTGTLALAGNTPSLTQSLAPETGTLALSGNTPSVTQQLGPTTGTLALAGNTPTLKVSLEPITGTLALAGNSPGLTTTLAATTGTLSLVGNSPTIDIFSGTTLTPTTGTLSLSGNTPTLKITLEPITGTLGLVGNTPALQTAYTPSTGTLALSGNAPTLSIGVILNPTTGTLALTGNVPSLTFKYVVTPTTGELRLVGNRPAIFGQDIKAESSEGAVGGGKRDRKKEEAEWDRDLKRRIKEGKKKQRKELAEQYRKKTEEKKEPDAGHYAAKEEWKKGHEEHEEWVPEPSREDELKQAIERKDREREEERRRIEEIRASKLRKEQAREKLSEEVAGPHLKTREYLSTILFEHSMDGIDALAREIIRKERLDEQKPDEDAMAALMLAQDSDDSVIIAACNLMLTAIAILTSDEI